MVFYFKIHWFYTALISGVIKALTTMGSHLKVWGMATRELAAPPGEYQFVLYGYFYPVSKWQWLKKLINWNCVFSDKTSAQGAALRLVLGSVQDLQQGDHKCSRIGRWIFFHKRFLLLLRVYGACVRGCDSRCPEWSFVLVFCLLPSQQGEIYYETLRYI